MSCFYWKLTLPNTLAIIITTTPSASQHFLVSTAKYIQLQYYVVAYACICIQMLASHFIRCASPNTLIYIYVQKCSHTTLTHMWTILPCCAGPRGMTLAR